MTVLLFILTMAAAGGFAFLNGFHDASNAVAGPMRTGALTARAAVSLTAFFNFIGVLFSTGLVTLFLMNFDLGHNVNASLSILFSAAVAAICWGLLTWWQGVPSSSTHALIGGYIGASFAAGLVNGDHKLDYFGSVFAGVALPLLVTPLVAFILGVVLTVPVILLAKNQTPSKVNSRSRAAQSVLAALFALGHGIQDGGRAVLLVMLALTTVGVIPSLSAGGSIPLWVLLAVAVLFAAGTLGGGWRISYTLAYRLVRTDPARAMTAQSVSTVLLLAGAIGLHWPVSSTHTLASALVGTGIRQSPGSIGHKVLAKMVITWLVTALATALMAVVLNLALSPLMNL